MIVLAAMTFHDEPITLNRLVGVIVGYVGVIVLVFPGLVAAAGGSEFTGELALLGSTVAYAIGAVYSRRNIKGLRPMIPAVFQVGFAFVMVCVLALADREPLRRRSGTPAPSSPWSGSGCSGRGWRTC